MNAPSPSRSAPPDDPLEKPYPGFAREKAALDAKVELAGRAGSTPLPGPLRAAFAEDAPTLHGFRLQPVTMGLHPVLVQLNSPLLEIIRILREELTREDGAEVSTPDLAAAAHAARVARAQARMGAEIKADLEGQVETVFAFTRPVAEVRELLARGRDAFRELALREIADKLSPAHFADLEKLVGAHYAASFATGIQYEAARSGDDGTVFSPPPASATASAGGSRSSVC